MKISEVNITPVKPQNGHVAFASIVIDNGIYLSSIAIHTKLDGTYRLLYPNKKIGERFVNLFNPISREASKQIENAIFKKCEEIFERSNEDDRYSQNTSSTSWAA